ncbi:hypothetical protein NLG97_g10314 [Lecanicillium saksenae]|uniref:Uncharacterized protein n=1 Tax=Lecanicillium saksenae TaxID=468837 RepID=A0ACC1QDR1_9HYPO|nr:hypothetical protein NLG97_g10314 [Lecanicillium saksenae]
MSAPRSKVLIQMSGAPGSGKSTLARLLGSSMQGVVVNHDVLRSSFLASGLAFEQAAQHAYKLQWTLVEDFLSQGLSVIVDSTCNYQMVLDQGTMLAERHGCGYWYVECATEDVEELDRRLRGRTPMLSQRSAVDEPPVGAAARDPGRDQRKLYASRMMNPRRPAENAVVVRATDEPSKLRDEVLKRVFG